MDKIVCEKKIEKAYIQAARIVAEYGEKYLPIFERLEQELHDRRNQSAAIKRALKIASTANHDA